MNRIDRAFSRLRRRGEAALIPFVTAGDPDLDTTEALVLEMARRGADIVELGIPFSDPLADGPTIQAASQRALEGGVTPAEILGLVRRIRRRSEVPLVLMGYYNPVLQFGLEAFAAAAAEAGADGTIVPDLPLEEAGPWSRAARAHGLANVLLAAPTTPPERVRRLAAATRGFLYYVSVAGITGARSELPPELAAALRAVKGLSRRPVAVGFGISRADQVAALAAVADGIIVGSALVRLVEAHCTRRDGRLAAGPGLVAAVGGFVAELKAATRTAAGRRG
ncbi:tryptophan synthase subunit alpha [Dissulfurirhabdus thermomarina]|uniref:Tryptophan synthase alpha chain n=1 Tax=Dissulfurirhabdus thermomarina TaxID=1765737 RepID=A0A6N9TML1_DISTH|nr:tryptophan synthase subunit alpha [Dissulfurirhabdus thermomarina]NDY42522.1 tryptophan synthase subunit alpha [Dissulfurirhabdus thermomarina]NMX24209.1 tryptophan synthase subunit alpha [Dissulfurirhabdus thermomarina]